MSATSNLSANYYVENNIRYVFMDGNACKHINDCYTTLQQQLSLPDYFGKNLDALEEVLADLDWIKEEKIKMIISNSDALLSGEIAKKKEFLDILNSSENVKLEIIYLGMSS
ncbi:MAG: barstar family protein [Bacteroidota bacterium]|nr:barstar family protein [Bacteroidota bacterium]